MSYGASIAGITQSYKDDPELRRRIEQMRAQAQGANPAMATPEPAQPQRQIYDIDDPQSPYYRQRHGGSLVTGLIDSAVSGATLPRDVYKGDIDLEIGQPRHWSEPDPAAERVLDATGLAMTGGFAGSGKGGTTIASGVQPPKASAQAVQSLDDLYREAPKSIRAYHGSPHDFDRFDLSKIGTGEGAQAYGHGLYFAENEGIAKSYRDALSKGPITDPNSGRVYTHDSPYYDDAVKEFGSPGKMYEVEIDADPAQFLDWDAPLDKQSEIVDLLRGSPRSLDEMSGPLRRKAEAIYSGEIPPDADGQTAYNLMRGYHDPAGASQRLAEAGIPGIKYLDQGSRSAGEGSRNYVTFRDDIVKILRKYGVASMAALPPAVLYDIQQKYGVGPSSDEREVY